MSEEVKTYEIGEHIFYVPKKLSYRQYEGLVKILAEAKLDLTGITKKSEDEEDSKGGISVAMSIGKVIQDLISGSFLIRFIGTILVPKEESKWKEKFLMDYSDVIPDIDESQVIEIIQDFLAGRGDLIQSLGNALPSFQLQKESRETT